MTKSILNGAQAQGLALAPFTRLTEELISWRSEHEIQQMQKDKTKGRVFDFVKGLRFSAQLIYIIRGALSRYGLEVDWGQIVSDNGASLSPECDVVIHRRGYHQRWNGGKTDQIMDFKFICQSDALVVISCKSLLTSVGKEHKDYCDRLKPYLKRKKPWLFAECVPKGKGIKIAKDAEKAGYHKFWYLYDWDNKNSLTGKDPKIWLNFLNEIDKLGKEAGRR